MNLTINNVSKAYGSNKALQHFTANLEPGIYALLGPNGSGKSTLMNIITDNLKADEGEILFSDGGEPQKFASDSTIKADFCFYTQNYIYYSAVSQKLIGKTHGEDLYCDVYDIRRVSYKDGVCEEVFREFPEGYETFSMMGGYIVVGNYIYTHTADWSELKDEYEDGDYRYDSGFSGTVARIDIQTGEVTYVGR